MAKNTKDATALKQRRERLGRTPFSRRGEILTAAARVFFEKGYEATSTQDIADSVGLLKGSLYYYIDSKEDFLFEIVKTHHDGALELVERARQPEGTALERLALLISLHVSYLTTHFISTAVYFRDFRSLSDERQRLINAEGDAYLDFVQDLLQQGQLEGTVSPSVDVRVASLAVVGMINYMQHWYQPNGRMAPDKIGREFAAFAIGGLASDDAALGAGSIEALRTAARDASATQRQTR